MDNQTTEATMTSAAPKKVYDTPYVPRGQWFKMMREKGLLTERQPKAATEKKPAAKKPASTKAPAKKNSAPKATAAEKPVRSEAQLRAIRGFYARKRQAAMAA